MNAEALALAGAERSSGSRHVARRILAAAALGFAMIVVLGGRARADILDPVQTAAEPATEAVGQAVEAATAAAQPIAGTATDAVGQAVHAATAATEPVVGAATETVGRAIETATDAVGSVVDGLGQLRRTAAGVLPSGRGLVGQDPALPQPPISQVAPPDPETPPVSRADPSRISTSSLGRAPGIGSTAPPPYLVHPGTRAEGAPPSGTAPVHRGPFLPFGPFGGGLDHGQLVLLVLLGAIVASLTVRPPPIRASFASRVDAPNGAALALSVERPG